MNSDEPISEADYKWRVTRTDGVAVSSYAFDDFGRNVDPFTGKIKETSHKHGYKADGNIIQPFAFTGYQEDEISGLKFAQARFYSASTGRFQSEDNVKGFINSPFTLNYYGYCWGNPVGLIDRDGNLPTWNDIKHGASNLANNAINYVKENPKQVAIGAALTVVGVGVAVVAPPLELGVIGTAVVGGTVAGFVDAGFQEMTTGKIDVSEVIVSSVFGAATAGVLTNYSGKIASTAAKCGTSKLVQAGAKLGIEAGASGAFGFGQSLTNDIVNLFDKNKENDYSANEMLGRAATMGMLETGGAFSEGLLRAGAKKIANKVFGKSVRKNKGQLWETWTDWAENGTARQRKQGVRQINKWNRKISEMAEKYIENSWIGKAITGGALLGTNIEEELCTD